MKTRIFFKTAFLLLFIIIGSHRLFAQAGWKIIDSKNSVVVSGKPYYLQVDKNDFFLRYKSRDYGINLKWGKTDSPNITFYKSGRIRQINCGDKVAIHVKGGGYLKYQKRKWGINLVWSKTPVYQWELRSVDNKKGTPIRTNVLIGILNIVENKNQGDFMVYCQRKNLPVVNLAWYGDCSGGSRLPGKLNNFKTYIDFAVKHKEKLLLLL